MRLLTALAAALAVLGLAMVTPVAAASPDNDTFAGRTVVRELPFADRLDTTEATTDADDAAINTRCGLPATEASVWYELTLHGDVELTVDASASDYSVGLILALGDQQGLEVVACDQKVLESVPAGGGRTYVLLAVDIEPADGIGGLLALSMDATAPPPPPPPSTVELTVDLLGMVDRTSGVATISGTLTCPAEAGAGVLDVELHQDRGYIRAGVGGGDPICDGTPQPWSVDVFSGDPFVVGRAFAIVGAGACAETCEGVSVDRHVVLRP